MVTLEQHSPSSSDQQQSRRRIKAHRKSRAGCFTCKGRKIRCCETRPQCKNCSKADLQCVYPESQPMAVSLQLGRVQYQSRGFSLKDMRFFHDYMTASYPHWPLNCESAWRNDIPRIAQQHEFLMHGILALGASHLHAKTNLDLTQTVERHRALAMRGLLDSEGEADAGSPNAIVKESRLNAQLATAYALIFTSSYLRDPISHFMILVRSCSSLARHMMRAGYTSPLFKGEGKRHISAEQHLDALRPRLMNAPRLPYASEIIKGKQSLASIENLCNLTASELQFLRGLQSVFEEIDTPVEAYRNFIGLWDLFTYMSAPDFAHFTDPSNIGGVALQAHFMALAQLLRPWLLRELFGGRFQRVNDRSSGAALPSTNLDDEIARKVLAWPNSFVKKAQQYMAPDRSDVTSLVVRGAPEHTHTRQV